MTTAEQVSNQPAAATVATPAIAVENIVKRYGAFEAVKGVTFEVADGEIFGLLGPNGAGKSTLIRMMTTLIPVTSGRALIAGHDVVHEPDAVRRLIGVIPQALTSDIDLTVEENLSIYAKLYGVPRVQREQNIARLLEAVDLTKWREAQTKTLSGGMRRRLEIARGLMHSPRVLFLDEPTVGLDPQTRASIWTYIRELKVAEDITIFLTTHYMDEAENCDRIAIMDKGKIIVLDTPEALKSAVGKDRVQIQTDDDDAAIAALAEHFDIKAQIAEGAVTFGVPGGEQFVPRLFAELGVPIRSVSVSRPSLDDVFMLHTGSTIRDAEEDAATNQMRTMARAFGRR